MKDKSKNEGVNGSTKVQSRTARQAAALRENLKKRKALTRAKATSDPRGGDDASQSGGPKAGTK